MPRITHIPDDEPAFEPAKAVSYEDQLTDLKDQLHAMVVGFIMQPKQSKIAKIMDAAQRYHDHFMEREVEDGFEDQLVNLKRLEAYDSCHDGSMKEEIEE